ncbi:MAG: pyridoxamine kinase [Bacteroidales bacterium]|nr:pyridoxamine kinase [Bacteroidales bacterium]
MKKKILLINDMAGYGKVATAAMLPILSYMGVETYNLPTALVSNTLSYPNFTILDTTDYIKKTLPVWEELGFRFDALSTGFLASPLEANIISEYCQKQADRGVTIFCDPIMGDDGELYNGVDDIIIASMRKMVAVADVVFPNYTEACLLTDTPYKPEGLSRQEAFEMADNLRQIGAKNVVITSCIVYEEGEQQHCVILFNANQNECQILPYHEIPVSFPGTGDIFSAIFIGNRLNNTPLLQSTQAAMDIVAKLIYLCKDQHDKNRGIPLEKYLGLLNRG